MKRRRDEHSQARGSKPANAQDIVKRNSMELTASLNLSHDADRPEIHFDVSESKTSRSSEHQPDKPL